MNKTFKKALILLAITVPFSLLIPYVALNLYGYITLGGVPVKSIPVQKQYQKAFKSTCGIHTSGGTGTGILLNTGYILTAKHAVDVNHNGRIDRQERKIQVKFHSLASTHAGTIIYASNNNADFVVVIVPGAPKSDIKLMSNKDYKNVLAGAPLFAIGRSMGQDPPHFTKGIRSTDNKAVRDRAAISIFYGNSGGGIFDEESGELIGLANRIQIFRGMMTPSWAEYIPPDVIRHELGKIGLGPAVDLPEKPSSRNIHLYSLLGVLIVTYVLVRRRRLRKNLCNMC